MNTCDTCKWWSDECDVIKGLTQAVTKGEHKFCNNEKVYSGCDLLDGLSDNADVFYGLTTGPKFGCIHHEPK